MSGTQIFVGTFAIISIAVSLLGIWRVVKAPGVKYKPLWIISCLLGFVGFAADMSTPGDLYLQFGIQIPVLIIWVIGGEVYWKTLFPVVAAVAIVRFRSPGTPQASEHSDLNDTFR